MVAVPIRIGDRCFPSKFAAVRAIRDLYYRYAAGDVVDDPEDHRFLLDLVYRHPRAEQKVGCGVALFRIEQDEASTIGTGRSCHLCVLVRIDGSETDFSYKKCLTPESPRSAFQDACRTAVVSQVQAFRREQFGPLGDRYVPCAITGELVGWNDAHIDHHEPRFEQLVIDFLRRVGWNYRTILLKGYGDGERWKAFADPVHAEQFAEYHREHARLRVTTRAANLGRSRFDLEWPEENRCA